MAINYTALKTEIQTDPKVLGYAPFVASGSDWQIANLLNTVGASNEKVNQQYVQPRLVVGCIVYTEWATVAVELRQYLQMVLQDQVDVNNVQVKAAFQAAFAVGSVTRTNITALLNRSASRAEALFGAGTVIAASDVAIARAS